MKETQIVREIYHIMSQLPRFNCQTPPEELPANGVYFFFEDGEVIDFFGNETDRIVRVGINTLDGRFRERISQHYGNITTHRGNRKNSAFRRHYGAALLREGEESNHPASVRDWVSKNGPAMPSLEAHVSRLLQNHFTFSCIRVDDQGERQVLERGLIALLAQHPLSPPSEDWLGKHAINDKISINGLWNVQHTNGRPLTQEEFFLFRDLGFSTVKTPHST